MRVDISFLILLLLPITGHSATIWCNPANTGTEDGTAKVTGYDTLHEAMSAMSANDTVMIADGDWRNTADMYIDATDSPPSGTGGNYSKIHAESDWGVKLPYINIETLSTDTRGYIEVRGIVFDNQYIGSGTGHIVYHMNHFKYIRCGFLAHGLTGNNHAAGFGNGDPDRSLNEYNLMEECIIWGSGRYMQYSKYGQYNIFRRVVIRHDASSDAGQIFNFRAYACDYHIYQNCISIDSDRTQYYTSPLNSEAGGYWLGDQYGAEGNEIVGSISIKDVQMSYYIAGFDSNDSASLSDSVALDLSVVGADTLTALFLKSNTDVTATNILGVDANTTNMDGFYGKNGGDFSISNSIIKNVEDVGMNSVVTADYVNRYNAGTIYATETNAITTDPESNGLLYPVRIESGSNLETAGSGGGVVGPTILKKIGVSGTLYGETGWNTVTNDDLWPYPNEDTIKTLMSSTVSGVSGEYGFTTGTSEDGTAQTLTKYIWEYLGNEIPSSIYGESSAQHASFGTTGQAASFNNTGTPITIGN